MLKPLEGNGFLSLHYLTVSRDHVWEQVPSKSNLGAGGMKVSAEQGGKKGTEAPSDSPRALRQEEWIDDDSDFPADDAFASSPEHLRDWQQLPPRPTQTPTDHAEERQTLLVLTQDASGHLALETAPVLEGSGHTLVDAITPLIRKQISNISGMEIEASSEASSLTAKAGRVQKHPTTTLQATLPLRRKRSQSRGSVLSEKRLRPSQSLGIEVSTGNGQSMVQETKVKSPGVDSGDADADDDPKEDDDIPVVVEETECVRLDNTSRISEYYWNACEVLGQNASKIVSKVWIRLRHPKKQSVNQYNGGNGKGKGKRKGKGEAARETDQERTEPVDDNPGRHTAPEWWPPQDDWEKGRGCRHREPDHLKKLERLLLLPFMLRFTGKPGHPEHFTVAKMRERTKDIAITPEQAAILEQLYQVREQEQAFEEGEKDGSTLVYLTKHKRQRSHKQKKKCSEKSAEGKRVKRESRARQSSAKQPTPASTPSTMESSTESLNPSSSSAHSPPELKREQSARDFGYPNSPQVLTVQHSSTSFLEGVHGPMLMSSSADYNFDALVAAQGATPFFQGTRVGGEAYMTDSMANERGRMSSRQGNNRSRRHMSVARQPSSAYDNGTVPLDVGYNFQDDQCLSGFKMPRISHGRPTAGLVYPVLSPHNHPHGLPAEQQLHVCATYDCPNSHTHGWRPVDEQARICAQHGCTLDPASHELVWRTPEQQSWLDQQYAAVVPASTIDPVDIEVLMEAKPEAPW
ncbi:MAG: hypothetical protein Q9218_002665 [Villophora microphyllina]